MSGRSEMDMDLAPCPFCGTDPASEEHPVSLEVIVAPVRQVELSCGKCGAMWPPVTASMGLDDADEVEAFWNERAQA